MVHHEAVLLVLAHPAAFGLKQREQGFEPVVLEQFVQHGVVLRGKSKALHDARAVHVVAVFDGHAVYFFHGLGQPFSLHFLSGLQNLTDVFGRGEGTKVKETVFSKKRPLLGREGTTEGEAWIISG